MANKDRPLVDRHAPKNGVGWLMNDQEDKVCSFTNNVPTKKAQWVVVETRPLRGGITRDPKIYNLFQIADVDSGVISSVNAYLTTHVFPWP